MNANIPFIPVRESKPRKTGLTMVMDKGLSVRQAEDFAEVASEYADFVKLGFGTSLITPKLDDKIKVYKEAGLIPYFGGTLFEAFVVRDMFDDYLRLLDKYQLDLAEVSDGSYEIEHDKKLEYISKMSERGTVISEVGSKKKDVVYTPEQWVDMMLTELEAGSFKVIAEAREAGNTGIYNADGSINQVIMGAIMNNVKVENVLWEAPIKSQQIWLIKQFGQNVNVGNIAPTEVIPLETLRLGLRGDTFFQFLPSSLI